MKARIVVVFLLVATVSGGYFKYRELRQHIYDAEHPTALRNGLQNQSQVESTSPQPIAVPPAPQLTPKEQALRNSLRGMLYRTSEHFAVFNWDLGALAFFDLPSGTVLCRGDGMSMSTSLEKNPNARGQVAALCVVADVAESGECRQPVYPKAKSIVRSEVLQVLTQRGASPDSRYLLVSSERYRASRNTALNPVADPFYAIYELSGKEIYRLPKIDVSSGAYVFAMGIDPSQPAALFGIGGLMDVCNAEEDYHMPANVGEVFIWTPPSNLRRVKVDQRTPEVERLMKQFGVNDFWFRFFEWPAERHGC